MEKIIILTGDSETNDRLITCVGMLFPECEIRVLSRRADSFEEGPVAPEPALSHNDCRILRGNNR